MELGSLDLGRISLSDETKKKDACSESRNSETTISSSSIVKTAKSKSPKGSPPNALNRLASQIKKPPHRKTSPISWFPRKKGDSYLNRKIKLLQEAGGMNDTLDETLGHSNPHYCRVEREKIAAKEAARRVMNTRKAAMVEASWCRILQAARIPSKEAEALVLKAEEEVSEAVEGAIAKGVIMYDTPDRALKHFEIETSSVSGKGSTTHTVKAAFETAFEVDKQVALAVKTAFIRLAHCSSFNRDEFKDLLRKISENPDHQELSESDNGSEFGAENKDDTCNSQRKPKKKSSPQKFKGTMLVDMMLERLKCLNEDELASLATIVATCGLNGALANTGNHNRAQEKVEQELPSLDKFLVKKMTKLEREVQEARNARKSNSENPQKGNDKSDEKTVSTDAIQDLGTSLLKRSSKLEKEIEEAKRNQNTGRGQNHGKSWKQDKEEEVPSLDKVLVKHVSRLEREVLEAKNRRRDEQTGKENADSNRKEQGKSSGGGECGGLDEVLVKHVSKLEKAKMGIGKERLEVKKKDETLKLDTSVGGGGLDQILVKHKSRLEREKTNASQQHPDNDMVTHSIVSRRQAREKELLEMWGGVGLGNSSRPHVSRLEREKAAWLKAEEEERRTVLQEQ